MKPNPTVNLNLKTARVITTLKCTRNCSYCVNKKQNIKDQMKPLPEISELIEYDLICLTGGEPLLEFEKTKRLITALRSTKFDILIYMYASIWTADLQFLLPFLDGIHYTLHNYKPVTQYQNTKDFRKAQELFIPYSNKKSFRLSLSPDIANEIPIIPYVWKEIRIKKWFSTEECIVPVHEDLFILED